MTDEQGKKYEIDVDPTLRIHLSGAGYVTEPMRRRGRQGNSFWSERWDLTDPVQVAEVEGLNDNVGWITCNASVAQVCSRRRSASTCGTKAVPSRLA